MHPREVVVEVVHLEVVLQDDQSEVTAALVLREPGFYRPFNLANERVDHVVIGLLHESARACKNGLQHRLEAALAYFSVCKNFDGVCLHFESQQARR